MRLNSLVHFCQGNFRLCNQIEFKPFFVNYGNSEQIEQRARTGKIFARWHLAIAVISFYILIALPFSHFLSHVYIIFLSERDFDI